IVKARTLSVRIPIAMITIDIYLAVTVAKICVYIIIIQGSGRDRKSSIETYSLVLLEDDVDNACLPFSIIFRRWIGNKLDRFNGTRRSDCSRLAISPPPIAEGRPSMRMRTLLVPRRLTFPSMSTDRVGTFSRI